jgi:RIO kinase 1
MTGSSLPDTFDEFVETGELETGQRWSTWDKIGVLAGPEPWPAWLITADAAIDTELGILKTGKEADVHLLERATETESVVLAAKRYRGAEHRLFHRDDSYTEGRTVRRSRDRRAVARGTAYGRTVQAGQWAVAEFGYLSRFWSEGLPVPYPVQLDETELLLELVTTSGGDPAPRLAQTRPDLDVLESYWRQLTEAMRLMVRLGLTHGDLSAYNILAAGPRLVIIDLPQIVDLVGNLNGMDFLMRDCANICGWFRGKGLEVDEHDLFGELLAHAF